MNITNLMNAVMQVINAFPGVTRFELSDLAPFQNANRSDRIAFGQYFSEQVQNGMIPNVRFLTKDVRNHSFYIAI
jgi:hypothetical protein